MTAGPTLITVEEFFDRPARSRAQIGDPDDPAQETDMLARSPISRVDDITAPMLLIHGANDLRINRRHSDRVVAAAPRRRGGVPAQRA